ncbi:MAG: HTTM domain-containing protein [Polyangiaceae bacterium]
MPTARELRKFFVDRYLTVDTRTLALFRVYFGIVMFVDIARRFPFVTMLYSNEGVLPNHFALYAPLANPAFSFFNALSTPSEVRFFFAAGLVITAAYTVGFATRFVQVLAFLFMTSLSCRNLFVENGGVVVTGVTAAWAMFFPLGDRWSVDAWVRSRSEGTPRPTEAAVPTAHTSLAMLGVTVQIAFIYFLNMIQKGDPTWTSGDAVHWVLWQNRIATPFTAWLRLHEPSWFSWIATRGTIVLEGTMPLLVLSPFFQRFLRPLHVLSAIALHGGIALMMTIGPFSWSMIALNLLLIPGDTWDRAWKWLKRRRPVNVNVHVHVPEVPNAAIPPSVATPTNAAEPPGPADASATLVLVLRESLVAVFFTAVLLQIFHDNHYFREWPEFLRRGPQGPMRAMILYPRLLQGWSMFASIPRGDGSVVVDAVTSDGRHVDPLTGDPPDFEVLLHDPPGMSQLECDYYLRISNDGVKGYRENLLKFLRTYTNDHGVRRHADFRQVTVYWVTSASPPPGSTKVTPGDRRVLAAWDSATEAKP